MPPPTRRRRPPAGPFAAALALAWALSAPVASRAQAQALDAPARQVTVFGVIATPGDDRIDPKLEKVKTQLRKLFPNHGFRLLDVKSKRLAAGDSVVCNLEAGFTASTTLVQPADENGKVQLRCAVLQGQAVQLESLVTTPPNQLFFCEKLLPDNSRLLIGVGAR